MLHSVHFLSSTIPGCASPDGYLPCSGVSGRALSLSPSSPFGDFKFISNLKVLSLRDVSKATFSVCNATSSNNYRKNPDFTRQNKFIRNKNRHSEEKEGYEEFEESEALSSRNGSLLSSSGNQKTLTPGPREKEIVELFRKVQAQLRERAAGKEERKVEESQDKGKDSETVDSLLKLLRKHSVQQGKKNPVATKKRDFVRDKQEQGSQPKEEVENTLVVGDRNTVVEDVVEERARSRPKSNFQKRSPVPVVKLQPVYSKGLDSDVSKGDLDGEDDDLGDVDPMFAVDDDMSEDESSEIYEEDEQDAIEGSDLSAMKLIELRDIARSRGVKGFSKLKKNELIELLSGAV